MSKTYTVSIALKIRRHEHGKDDREITWQEITGRTLLKLRQTAAATWVERVYHLLEQLYERFDPEHRNPIAKRFPKHTLFCECRKCNKSFTSYWQYLRKELQWNKDGHLA